MRQLGPCRSGCGELDDHVLLSGGFERGSVVGVSAEDDGMGLALGLQVLSRELLDSPSGKALLVTPRPAAEALRSLRDSLGAQMPAGDVKACLDRVMLSCVFDMDGLWEVLSDLDDDGGGGGGEEEEEPGSGSSSPAPPPPPSIILITHFSALLAALFTQRAREAAHGALALLGAHLRHLSRSLASHPLVVILNSVAVAQEQQQQQQQKRHGKKGGRPPLDRSLQSIFNPPPLHIPGYKASSGALRRAKKPSFGLVFTQLLDLHLLCSRVARTRDDAEMGVAAGERDGDGDGDGSTRARFVTVVEVLMDEMGLWQGKRGPRPSREQRWTAVDVVSGRIRCAM